jgi:hypothetical protein
MLDSRDEIASRGRAVAGAPVRKAGTWDAMTQPAQVAEFCPEKTLQKETKNVT